MLTVEKWMLADRVIILVGFPSSSYIYIYKTASSHIELMIPYYIWSIYGPSKKNTRMRHRLITFFYTQVLTYICMVPSSWEILYNERNQDLLVAQNKNRPQPHLIHADRCNPTIDGSGLNVGNLIDLTMQLREVICTFPSFGYRSHSLHLMAAGTYTYHHIWKLCS